MKKLALFLTLVALPFTVRAASTINATDAYAWGANIGWTNWLPSPADGVVIGEFICSGYIYGANVGWINLGNGSPVNHIQYQNNSATDFGVNYTIDSSAPGYGVLRGFAYGANIGWINFNAPGFAFPSPPSDTPRVDLTTGELTGYVYSANCGWINLKTAQGKVRTDHIAMGVDSDGDGIADAFEYLNFGNLTTANASSDADHDGISDKEEYLDGTSPIISTDRLRITAFATNSGGTSSPITWTSTTARLYQIETKPDLAQATWDLDTTFGMSPSYTFAPDSGTTTMRTVTATTGTKRFYRVKSIRPLP
jgi:hypothetical protein